MMRCLSTGQIMQHVAKQHGPNVVRHPYTVPGRIKVMAQEWRQGGLPEWRIDLGVALALMLEMS